MESYKKSNLILILSQLFTRLSKRRRYQLFFLLLTMIASGIAEMLTLASIIPFLSLISSPSEILNQSYIQNITKIIGINETNQLLLLTTLIFCLTVLFSSIIRIGNLWLGHKLVAKIGSDLSCDIYLHNLYQPYSYHIKSNSSEIITTATSYITATISVLQSSLRLINSLFISTFLVISLLLIDWHLALFSTIIFALLYFFLGLISKNRLFRNSKLIATLQGEQIKSLQEGLGAIRDVILDHSQKIYFNSYCKIDKKLRETEQQNAFLGNFPRFSFEAIGLILIALFALFVSERSEGVSKIIPILGSFALGAQKLLPAIQNLYGSWAAIKSQITSIENVILHLNKPLENSIHKNNLVPLKLNDYIKFSNISFKYSDQKRMILDNINLQIFKGERIGIIGQTGSGKSTILDLIMGLLIPIKGQIYIDSLNLHDQNNSAEIINKWRISVAHVPQAIFLADTSIAENIAFGIPKENIDIIKVKKVAEEAKISNFIESIPNKYNTFVGERGVRLSGGQRQRIGIARALYKETELLIFDEATSALDSKTESDVINSIENLNKNLTIIVVAHRLETLKNCDRIFSLDNNNLKEISMQ